MKYDKLLADYCRWDKYKNVIKLLNEHNDLDLTAENGICFRFAIKHNNITILNTLFAYYTKYQLQTDDHDSMAYKLASFKLRNILQDAVDAFEVSTEMQKLLDPYLVTVEDENDQDLGELDEDEVIPALDTDHANTDYSSASDSDFHSGNSPKLTADLLSQYDHSNSSLIGSNHSALLSGPTNHDLHNSDLLGNANLQQHDQ